MTATDDASTSVSWPDAASCRDQPYVRSWVRSDAHQKRHVCLTCPVLDVCLWATMLNEQETGRQRRIAAGATHVERDWLAVRVPAGLWPEALIDAETVWRRDGAPTVPVKRIVCRCGKIIDVSPRTGRQQIWCSEPCRIWHRDHATSAPARQTRPRFERRIGRGICIVEGCGKRRAPQGRLCERCRKRRYLARRKLRETG